MSDDPKPQEPYAEFARVVQQPIEPKPAGCVSAFVFLWGIALLLVGLLIACVMGYCGIAVMGSSGELAREFGGTLVLGFVIGVVLIVVGILTMGGAGRKR